jgi:hypothetical protein
MGRSSRLILVASLVFALFALWQAYLEYSNYSSVRSTLPTSPFDPLIGYRIGTMDTPSSSPTAIPRAIATSRGVRTAYHRNTATVTPTVVASNTPSPITEPSATPLPTHIPTASPTSPTSGETGIRFTVEPLDATWNDTVTVSWEVPNAESNIRVAFRNPHVETFFSSNAGEWGDLPPKGSRTVPLKDILGTVCQSREVVWELSLYYPFDDEPITNAVSTTVTYPDVPLSLTSISLSANPAPAHHPITLTWEGTGGTNLSWFGNSGIDNFGVDAGKHWRELRLEGASGTTSWTLNRHTPSNVYRYNYSMPGLPGICGTIALQMTCPFDYWIDEPELRLEESCPTSPPIAIPAAYQRFERGIMVWDSDLKMIHVLFDDGTNYFMSDEWQGNVITYAETPPTGLILPQQGFGNLWVTNEEVRSKLGWATTPEQGYSMTRQRVKNTYGSYFVGYAISGPIYFTLPTEQVVRVGVGEYYNGWGWTTLN